VPGFDHVVLNITAYPVLRTKQRTQINLFMFVKKIGGMAKLVVNRSLIANESNTGVDQQVDLTLK